MAKRGRRPVTPETVYKPDGRPIGDIVFAVCNRMKSETISLRKACEAENVPLTTVLRWCDVDEDLAEQYARARDIVLANAAFEIIDTSNIEPVIRTHENRDYELVIDSVAVAKAKLQADNLKWVYSRLLPKRLGDKATTRHEGEVVQRVVSDKPMTDEEWTKQFASE